MLFVFLACNQPDKEATDSAAVVAADINYLDIVPSIHSTEIETVKRIRWAGVPGDILRHQDSTGIVREVLSEGDELNRSALLFGVTQFSTVEFQIGRQINDEWIYTTPSTIEIGRLTSELPELQADSTGDWEGLLIFPIIGETQGNTVIVDSNGEVIWAIGQTSHPNIFNDGTLIQAAFSQDGQSILILSSASALGKDGILYKLGLDGTLIDSLAIDGGHLSFVEVANDHYYLLSYSQEDTLGDDGQPILADLIVELNQGVQQDIWNSAEAFPYSEFGGYNSPDWMHVNYLSYDAVHNSILLSITRLDGYASINASSGELEWLLSGNPDLSTIQVPAGMSQQFASMPHSIQALGNEQFLLFNRRSPNDCSEVVSFQKEGQSADLLFHFESTNTPCLQVNFLGQALQISDAQILANWSDRGQLDIVSPAGDLLWRLSTPLGGAFGFADHNTQFPE